MGDYFLIPNFSDYQQKYYKIPLKINIYQRFLFLDNSFFQKDSSQLKLVRNLLQLLFCIQTTQSIFQLSLKNVKECQICFRRSSELKFAIGNRLYYPNLKTYFKSLMTSQLNWFQLKCKHTGKKQNAGKRFHMDNSFNNIGLVVDEAIRNLLK